MAAEVEPLKVEVACATPERAVLVEVEVPVGTTAEEAVRRSGVLAQFPDLEVAGLGIFGRAVPPDHRVEEGDRVEIHRPLSLGPREARRRRAGVRRADSTD